MTIIASPAAPYAPIARRFGGYLIDAALAFLVLGATGIAPALLAEKPSLIAVGYLTVVVVGLGQWFLLGTRGFTLGKYVAGTRVVDADTGRPLGLGRAFVRLLVLGLLGSCFVLLIVLAFVITGDPRKQGWHDKAARSVEVLVPATRESEMWTLEPGSAILPSTGAARTTGPVPPPPPSPPTPNLSEPSPVAPVGPPPTAVPPGSVAPLRAGALVSPPPGLVPPPPARPPSVPLVPPVPQRSTPESPVVSETIITGSVHAQGRPPTAPIDEETRRPNEDAPPPSRPAAARWLLRSGSEERVIGGAVLIGRDPDPSGHAGATAWQVDDPEFTVSKTHALVTVVDGLLSIEDLDSTHGVVIRRNGDEVQLDPRRETRLLAGDAVVLGVFEVRVESVV
jgi:uncharacterized RDD family membrane protein YckC